MKMIKKLARSLWALVLMWLALCSTTCAAPLLSEQDKQMHAAVSVGLGVGAYALVEGQRHAPIKAFALAFGVGVLKEVYDSRSGGTGFSKRDLQADAIGALVGVAVGHGLRVHRRGVTYRRSF